MRLGWILALLLAFSSNSVLSAEPVRGFVKREGNRLQLEGRSFYMSGANQYYLFYKSRAMIDEVLEDAAAMGLNVLRTWAFCDGEWHDGHSFQPSPGIYHEPTFQNLDYAIYRAGQLGIRLILTLVNNWDAFGGMNAYVEWSPTAREHDDFYSDPTTRAIYKDYVRYVLERRNAFTGVAYKDEPAILMWELANEPRIAKSRVNELYRWIEDMSAHIKSIDRNHLVTTGSEGDYDTDLFTTHRSPNIDVVSFHLYPEDWNFTPDKALNYIRKQVQTAHQELRKPVFAGEFGLRNKGARDATYRNWYNLFSSLNIDGALFWLLSGRQDNGTLYPDYDGFTVYYPESSSTVDIIRQHANWAKSSSNRMLDTEPPRLSIEGLADGTRIFGEATFRGAATDNNDVARVEVSFGGVFRPATLDGDGWSFRWDSRESLDGDRILTIRAMDREDNVSEQKVRLSVDNQTYRAGDWSIEGRKEQDDGFNFIYFLAARNDTGRVEEGRFVARFFLRSEGNLELGAHYENSSVYQGNPSLSTLKDYFGEVQYFDIDLGSRRVEPGHSLGFKGQFRQADGGMKSGNDWTSADLSMTGGRVERVLWLKDGQIIGGSEP